MRLSFNWVSVLLLTQSTFAVTPATLIGPDLVPRQVNIQALRDDRLTYFDSNRDLRTTDLKNFVQIRDLPGSRNSSDALRPEETPQQTLELTDGQRLVGTWVGASDDGQNLLWRHGSLGSITVGLDQLRAIGLSINAPPLGPTTSDTLWLANGDTVNGVLTALRNDAIEWHTTGANNRTEMLLLPRSRIRAVRLAATSAPRSANHIIWVRDGSRLGASTFSLGSDLVIRPTLITEPESSDPASERLVQLPIAEVTRIDLASSQGHLRDLTTIPMQVTDGGRVFEVSMPPRLEAGSIWMHAPVTVRFDLPAGTSRFATVAELALGAEQRTQGWADMDLIVRSEDRIVSRHRLNAEHPRAHINVTIANQNLSIEVSETINGPVMDRILLRDPVLYVPSYQH